ncbi:MAG: dTDP-4-dehydrorhamnose reductase [Roseovarius sp.]|nr:dTDP-4-dehydrorhamnose reductase [Roseovarius sp.]
MILVFGKTGQVARELGVQGVGRVRALGRDEADLANPAACSALIKALAPTAVINAAAFTAVDRAETEEALATRINGQSPGAMAEACAGLAIPFCHVSTDYVFDGSGTRPWSETDPVQPQNAYGRSKLAGETAVLGAGGQAAILRTSWVFSAHGANFVKTMLRLGQTRDALNVVDDQIGGPTPAAAIAAALLAMVQHMQQDGTIGGIYNFCGAPAISWAGFAREIFAKAGHSVDITGIATSDYPTPASRPLNSRLNCAKFETDFGISQPDWQIGLQSVLGDLGALAT